MDRPTDITVPWLVLGGLSICVTVALLVAVSTSTGAFGAFNPSWEGGSELRSIAGQGDAEIAFARDTSAYAAVPANDTVAVILSPEEPYGPRDVARIERFLRRGGTVVIADDFGKHTNHLLERLNASARLDGRVLRDEQHNYRSPLMPFAHNVSDHRLVNGTEGLTLNYGTALRPSDAGNSTATGFGNGSTLLVNTSEFAYLDENRNQQIDESERLDTRPVAIAENASGGELIVVSDGSVLINAMLDRAGNRAFARRLVAGHERVLFDESHTDRLPPLVVGVLILRDSLGLQLLFGGLGIAAITAWMRWPDRRVRLGARFGTRRPEPQSFELSEDDVRAVIARTHPEWEDERIERLAKGVMSTRGEAERDR